MLEFILARGSYLLVIALMMTGLYITFEAQNMIKRLVGLSVFQTSVFLFYITLSKVAGGTAPILYGRDIPRKGYGEEASPAAAPYPAGDVPPVAGVKAPTDDTIHAPAEALSDTPDAGILQGEDASLMEASPVDSMAEMVDNAAGLPVPSPYDAVEPALYNIYSNPLPHVLILTAIVVGVSTLAVGLAIIVRIREAYGTIEADEVRHIDIDVALAEEADDIVPEGAA